MKYLTVSILTREMVMLFKQRYKPRIVKNGIVRQFNIHTHLGK